jgi:hypothetical protein
MYQVVMDRKDRLNVDREVNTVAGEYLPSATCITFTHFEFRTQFQVSSATSKLSCAAWMFSAPPPFCFTYLQLCKVALVFLHLAQTLSVSHTT